MTNESRKRRPPIVFFAYNRPQHALYSLESLSMCHGAEESELFIYCDGPKLPREKNKTDEVRKIVKSRKWCGTVHVINRDKNYGLAHSVIDGVAEIVNQYGRIIVLEDDLILSPYFLDYMNEALWRYRDEERVMHVSGYMYPIDTSGLKETFFYRALSCWGWGTWKRAWKHFEPDINLLASRFSKMQKHSFIIDGYYYNFWEQIEMLRKGRIDSWAIRWYASIFLNNGLCFHSSKSLVNNFGLDGTGIHCGETAVFDVDIYNTKVCEFEEIIEESEEALKRIKAYLRGIYPPHVRVYNKLRSIILR